MNSRRSAAKARNITLLAAMLTSQHVIAVDRLDDWSSPRPIKYAASGSYDAGRQPNTTTPSRSPLAVPQTPQRPEPSSVVRPPEPPVLNDSASPPLSTTGRALFPPAEPMRPEHRGQPTTTPVAAGYARAVITAQPTATEAYSDNAMPADRNGAAAMQLAAARRHEPGYPAAATADDRPSQSVLDVASLSSQPSADYQALDYSPPSLQLRPAGETNTQNHRATIAVEEQPLLPVPTVATKTVSNWQLGRLASQKIERAEMLLERQSPMTARQQAIEALHLIAQSTDETTHSTDGTEALTQALTAVREASDFLGRFGVVDAAALQRLVDSHSTRVLKRCDLEQVTPLRAADVYYEFARGRFVDAVAGWAPASRALMIVAKTEPLTSDVGDSNLSAAQICCLRSAIACDPDNAAAANELGHELLALGMFDEARWALEHSYAKQPSPAALQNLAELHRVTGNMELAEVCATNLAILQSQQQRVAQVVQLTPSQFAQMSPQVMSSDAGAPTSDAIAQRTNVQPAHTEAPQQGRVASTFDRVKAIFR
ncbi:hypothetical protein [Rosistilla oblonga]|uniref:tetratricopeptide repeat protein n=1 Tax=Rosistilla oblonga TaxID=2527990 RepID=UPI003A980C63